MVRRFSVMALSLWMCALAFLPHVAAAAPPDRAQAEQEIRKAIYELGSAQAAGDVETVTPKPPAYSPIQARETATRPARLNPVTAMSFLLS